MGKHIGTGGLARGMILGRLAFYTWVVTNVVKIKTVQLSSQFHPLKVIIGLSLVVDFYQIQLYLCQSTSRTDYISHDDIFSDDICAGDICPY